MGYYTFFDLTWDAAEDSDREQAITAWMEADEMRHNFEDLYPGGACGMSKWRDEQDDMLRLSEAFPEVLFTLSGSGEEETDLWRSYYRAGRVQHAPAEIHYPAFDPAKLSSADGESPAQPRTTATSGAPELDPASNAKLNTLRQRASVTTENAEPSFAGISQILAEQLDDRTIMRLYYGIRFDPGLCDASDYERPYRDFRAAEAELYNFAAAAGIEVHDEADQLERCRGILAREIREGRHITAHLPRSNANDVLFLAYLDNPEDYPGVDI